MLRLNLYKSSNPINVWENRGGLIHLLCPFSLRLNIGFRVVLGYNLGLGLTICKAYVQRETHATVSLHSATFSASPTLFVLVILER